MREYFEPVEAWFTSSKEIVIQPVVHEYDESGPVIFNHLGEGYIRPRNPIGFNLKGKE